MPNRTAPTTSMIRWVTLLLSLLMLPAVACAQDGLTGVWKVAQGDGWVRIYDKDGAYYGQAIPNPACSVDEAKRAGQPGILFGFHPDGDGRWSGGRICDPRNGSCYNGILTLEGPDRLKVYGYLGFRWLGGGTTWTRVRHPGTGACPDGKSGTFNEGGQEGEKTPAPQP